MIAAAAAIGLLLLLFLGWRFLWFFRDPRRRVEKNDAAILAPADGRIVYVRRTGEGPILSIKNRTVIELDELMHTEGIGQRKGWLIGTFMSPFDVHVNRAPVRGEMTLVRHAFPAGSSRVNLPMFNALSNLLFGERPTTHDCEYVVTNERATFAIRGPAAEVFVTQIADRFVHRIVRFVPDGPVDQGERFGMIRMGSQVDVFVPDGGGFEPVIGEGDRVRAGSTVLMERRTG